MSREIHLTQGHVALVDEGLDDVLSPFKWYALRTPSTVYAQGVTRCVGSEIRVLMHRLILGAESGMQVDHIDHNGLNNQRANLRLVIGSQNQANKRKQGSTSSRFKGVRPHSQTLGRWQARIKHNGRERHLGLFTTEIDAARAYDLAAIEQWGEFAWTNQKAGLL